MSFIEFIGIPGTGKSTIRNDLVFQLQKRRIGACFTLEEAFFLVAIKKIDKIYRVILNTLPSKIAKVILTRISSRSFWQVEEQNNFLAQNGKALEFFLASNEFGNLSIEDRSIVIGGFLKAGALYQCVKNDIPKNSKVFFDEGLIQKSMMFVFSNKKENDNQSLFGYLDQIPKPDIVIYIKADLPTCRERMLGRPKGLTERLQSLDKAEILKFLSISDKHMESVVSFLRSNTSVVIYEISGNENESVEDSVNKLFQEFRSKEKSFNH